MPHRHQIRLLLGSRELFPALIREMDRARSDIRMETYIFDVTGSAEQIAQALERAAQRGVRVWLVVDGVGTGSLPEVWRQRFDAAGVQWRIYSPLGALGLAIPSRWRRLHRKLCVVDGRVAFCGGINILDDLHDPHRGAISRPRLDFAVQATGALVQSVQETTARLWWRIQTVRHVRERHFPEAFSSFRSTGLHLPWTAATDVPDGTLVVEKAGLLLRDNVRHRADIEKAYRRAIGSARAEIIVANAYFLPGRKLRKALVMAARRGVRVRLLLQGHYEYFMQYHGVRPVYHQLLAAGIEIAEYQASFLHAKVAVVDAGTEQSWATVGSSNLDPLSLLLAREANVVVQDAGFSQRLRDELVLAIERDSLPVSPVEYANRPVRERLLDWAAFGLMRLALFLTGKRY
ncbi:MAG: cardiolipin synthase ClsB [Burkholderiaceae bacterium]|jgi:cardiolipin synthase|nr:cardiolipin synthase ClsB [Burkholderiaceae bacterium]